MQLYNYNYNSLSLSLSSFFSSFFLWFAFHFHLLDFDIQAMELFKLQQEREHLYKNQQLHVEGAEDLFKIQQHRERTYSKSSKRERNEGVQAHRQSHRIQFIG